VPWRCLVLGIRGDHLLRRQVVILIGHRLVVSAQPSDVINNSRAVLTSNWLSSVVYPSSRHLFRHRRCHISLSSRSHCRIVARRINSRTLQHFRKWLLKKCSVYQSTATRRRNLSLFSAAASKKCVSYINLHLTDASAYSKSIENNYKNTKTMITAVNELWTTNKHLSLLKYIVEMMLQRPSVSPFWSRSSSDLCRVFAGF